MKLKFFIPSLIAVLAMMVSCSDDNEATYLDEVRVSSSYVAIDVNGGTTDITVNAKYDWSIDTEKIPSWLTVSPTSGAAGESRISLSADKTLDGRTAELSLVCNGRTQHINVIQGLSTVSPATCAEVIAGPDSKTYRVTGTCTAIANTTYGNWYLQDETGQIYIYGTLDKKGAAKNFLSLGIEVGDIVTVEGPKTTYNGTVELVDVTVVKIEKSLIKVDSLSVENGTLPLEGGNISAYLTCKGDGVNVEIPDEAKDWLSIVSITGGANPVVTFRAAPNAGGDRDVKIVFTTTQSDKEYTAETSFKQLGAIVDATIADFNAAEVGNTQYRIKGVVSKIANASKGRFYLKDFSGETYIYNLNGFEDLGVKEGDILTVVGKRDQYNETIELTSGVVEDVISVIPVTIAEFLTKPDDKNVYYMVSGTIDEIANPTYGNLYIIDGSDRLYVYGCYPGYGATGDARKNFLADAGIEVGDELTMIGYKDTYNGTIELCGGIYFAHQK
jgi:hypothetical protein